ncbi:hypothetical protein [Pararobbsia silviterrae]
MFARPSASPAAAAPSASPPPLPETRSWHGDHWANLLTCPMDARHYVLEDWTDFDSLPSRQV